MQAQNTDNTIKELTITAVDPNNRSQHLPVACISKDQHQIKLPDINKHAISVLTRLQEAGHQAYLVGGGVRDLLLDMTPKDYDIATDARPEEVRALFRNCRLIGKRFRLAHVFFGRDILEVATFRASHPENETPDARLSDAGVLLRDNIYGTLEDDAWRRDFTVNALYLNSSNMTVLDHVNGMQDIKSRTIRVLGDPATRFQEDPVRMLRAIRLSAKLDFKIEKNASKEIVKSAELILHASPARLFDEIVKLFYCGQSFAAFHSFREHQLFQQLFPQVDDALNKHNKDNPFLLLIQAGCKNTDERIKKQLSLNPAFLFAVLLWGPLQKRIAEVRTKGLKPYPTIQLAIQKVIEDQLKFTTIPKRFTTIIQEIWRMQHALEKQPNKRAKILFARPRFRAAYDFLALRLQAGEKDLKKTVDWWTEYQLKHKPATRQSFKTTTIKTQKS
jgi:poly(A) polymerase